MPYRPNVKKEDGSVMDLPIEAETSVKLKTARSIGLSGVTAMAQNFDGTGNVTIPITSIPASLISGSIQVKVDINSIYPVGAIYMSVVSTNPSTLFGGTWSAWGTGRVPVGINTSDSNFSTVEKTGGSSTHTLTTSEMPSHNHSQSSHNHSFSGSRSQTESNGSHTHNLKTNLSTGSSTGIDDAGNAVSSCSTSGWVSSSGSHQHYYTPSGSIGSSTPSINSTGGGGSHNNLQPYITCYMWKRIA